MQTKRWNHSVQVLSFQRNFIYNDAIQYFVNNMHDCSPNMQLLHDRSRIYLLLISDHIKKNCESDWWGIGVRGKTTSFQQNQGESWVTHPCEQWIFSHMLGISIRVAEMSCFKFGWFCIWGCEMTKASFSFFFWKKVKR